MLAASVLGSSLAFIDGSVVNVALPTMQASLGADAAGTQWLINAYLLPLGALVLLGGAAGDRYGLRRVFAIGVALFALASLACAAAPGLEALLFARAVQGIAGAIVVPSSLAILGAAFEGEARGRAIGTWAAAGALTGAVGPVFGGTLVDWVGWRAVFLINVPLAGTALALARAVVPAMEPAENPPPLDWFGATLATAGLVALVWGLTAAEQHGWGGAPVLAFLGSAGLLASFLVQEARRGPAAMMPLGLFAAPRFVGVSLLTLLLYAALGGLVVLLPYTLMRVGQYSGAEAGAALLPIPVLMGVGSRAVGRWAERRGARIPLTAGPLLAAAGFVALARLRLPIDYVSGVLPALLILALGLTAMVAPLTATAIVAAGSAHAGIASGVNNALARIAGAIATALLGIVLGRAGAPETLLGGFRAACFVGAALSSLAAASAFVGLRGAR